MCHEPWKLRRTMNNKKKYIYMHETVIVFAWLKQEKKAFARTTIVITDRADSSFFCVSIADDDLCYIYLSIYFFIGKRDR